MDDRDRQAVDAARACSRAGGATCLAEPQPPTGEGCRENNRKRGDLALYCQRQADVAPPGSRLPVDVRPLLSAISVQAVFDHLQLAHVEIEIELISVPCFEADQKVL